jgi:hypothetical protein
MVSKPVQAERSAAGEFSRRAKRDEPLRTTPVSGAPRQPYCMMGVCFECLATVDGRPNRQLCLETVREGMVVETQLGAPRPGRSPGVRQTY